MFLFILALLLLVAGVLTLIGGGVAKAGGAILGGIVAIVLGGVILLFSSFYTQDVGDASVRVSFTGQITGQSTAPGIQSKAPWEHVETFNVRNQQVSFVSDGKGDNGGSQATGPQITVQDADGVSSNVDINLRYSIRPDKVMDIYKQYKTEDNFKQSFIQNDVRSVVRTVPNTFHTLDLLTKRNEVEGDVLSALEKRWAATGVTVDSVSLQEIRVPDSVKEKYADAVKSQIAVTQAQNELAAAKVSAQQVVVNAQAQATANRELEKSLTTNVLKQHALDTMRELAKSGNLVVTDSSGSTLLNVGK